MSILRTLTTLSLTKPSRDADRAVLAAWLDAKADMHTLIADQGGPEAHRARQLAAAARQRAAELRHDPRR